MHLIRPYVEGNTFSTNQTLISDNRIANLVMYSFYAKRIPGDYAEFGVFRGGATEILAKVNPEKYIYAIDSFSGLPAPVEGEETIHKKGDFQEVDLDALQRYFAWHHPNVSFYKGFSPEVFLDIAERRFAFVHIDVDLYQSVKDACEFFFNRMHNGGIMLFDDYKWETTPGAEQAIHEYFEDKEVKVKEELKYIDGTSHNQFIVIK